MIQISSLGACSLMTHLGLNLFQSHSVNNLLHENWMRKSCYAFYWGHLRTSLMTSPRGGGGWGCAKVSVKQVCVGVARPAWWSVVTWCLPSPQCHWSASAHAMTSWPMVSAQSSHQPTANDQGHSIIPSESVISEHRQQVQAEGWHSTLIHHNHAGAQSSCLVSSNTCLLNTFQQNLRKTIYFIWAKLF